MTAWITLGGWIVFLVVNGVSICLDPLMAATTGEQP
jgi:hypothetical protein